MRPDRLRPQQTMLAAILSVGAVSLLAVIASHVLPSGYQPPAMVRLVATLIAALLLPGLLFVLCWPERLRLDLLEALPVGFAVTTVGVCALCVAAIELRLPMVLVQWVPLVPAVLLLPALAVRAARGQWPVRSTDLRPRPSLLALLALTAAVSAFAYLIGGFREVREPDLIEEAPQIAIVQKVAVADYLDPDELMYMRDVQPTYYYPSYQFALGIVARLASVHPVAVFARLRGLATLLCLTGIYAATVALLESRPWARYTLLAALTLALSGQLSQPPAGLYWGPLAPLGHAADFGLGVVLPIGLALAGRLTGPRPPRFYTVGTPLFLVSAMTLHTREVAQLLVFFGVGAGALLALRPFAWRVPLRMLCLAVAVAAIASIYRAMLAQRVSYLAGFVDALNSSHTETSGPGQPFDWLTPGSVGGLVSQTPPVPSIALAALPLVLLVFWRRPGAVLLTATALFWATVTISAGAERFLATVIYGEIMWTPSRYLFHLGVIAIGLITGTVAAALVRITKIGGHADSRRSARLLVAAIVFANVLALSALWLPLPQRAVLLGAGLLLLCAHWITRPDEREARRATTRAALTILAAFAASSPALRILLSLPGRLPPQVQWACCAASAAAVLTWGIRRYGVRRSRAAVPAWLAGWARGPGRVSYMVAPVAMGLYLSSFATPMWWSSVESARRGPMVEDLDQWYQHTSFAQSLPAPIRTTLAAAPRGRIVAVESSEALAIPMFVPHFVLSSGWFFSTEMRYLEQWQALQADSQGGGRSDSLNPASTTGASDFATRKALLQALYSEIRPIFSETEEDEQTRRYLSEWDVSFVVVDPARHHRLQRLLDSRPALYDKLVSTPTRVLYGVRQAAAAGGSR